MKVLFLLFLPFLGSAQRLTQVEQYYIKGPVSIVGDTIFCDTTELSELREELKDCRQFVEAAKYANESYIRDNTRLEGEIETLNRSLDFQRWEYDRLRKDYEALVRKKKR